MRVDCASSSCVVFSGYTIFWNEKQVLTWNDDFTGDRMFTSKSALRLTCFCKSASCWFWFSNLSFCSCVHFIRSFRLEIFLSGVPCQKEVIGYFQINCSMFIERQFCIFITLILSGTELFRFSSRLVSFFFSCASSSSTLVTVSLFS